MEFNDIFDPSENLGHVRADSEDSWQRGPSEAPVGAERVPPQLVYGNLPLQFNCPIAFPIENKIADF